MKQRDGFALILALIVMVVVGILVVGALFNAITSQSVAANDRNATTAQYISQAGLSRFWTIASQSSRFVKDHLADYGFSENEMAIIGCSDGDYTLYGLDLDRTRGGPGSVTLPDGKMSRTLDMTPGDSKTYDITLPDGTQGRYEILFEAGTGYLRSQGWIGSGTLASSRGRATTAAKLTTAGNGGPNNAIFVRGFEGPAINGNVAVYGSVNSVKEDFADNQVALDMGGTSGVYNSYSGEGSAGSDIRTAITTLGGNADEDQLCARLKVKSGQVKLSSGSARIGVPDKKVLGVYLQEGASIVDNNGGTPAAGIVNVETSTPPNLWNKYEDNVGLPALDAGYPNEIGLTVTPANCPRLFQTVTGQVKAVLPPNSPGTAFSCGIAPNTIAWVPASGTTPAYLSISGVINTGNYDFLVPKDTGTGDQTLYYQGKGTIRVGNSPTANPREVSINRSFMPGPPSVPARQFVTDDLIGFVSNGAVKLAAAPPDGEGAPGKQMAGVFYSKGDTHVGFDTTVLGSIMAENVRLGSQVPRIAWDRRLANAGVPLGWPKAPSGNPFGGGAAGADPAGALRIRAWERR